MTHSAPIEETEEKNPVSEAIALVGLMPLAAEVGVSYQAIQKYERTQTAGERVIAVAMATGWRVTPHRLRPDLYPHPEDGLPEERRTKPRIGASA